MQTPPSCLIQVIGSQGVQAKVLLTVEFHPPYTHTHSIYPGFSSFTSVPSEMDIYIFFFIICFIFLSLFLFCFLYTRIFCFDFSKAFHEPDMVPCIRDKAIRQVVQTLARFMAAYFSNQTVYIFPPHNPQPLPAIHFQANILSEWLMCVCASACLYVCACLYV